MNVIDLLKKYDIRPKKAFGQNFLHAMPTLEKIVVAMDLTPDDVVIEVGAGLGVMTSLIAERAKHVTALEIDKNLFEIAKSEFGQLDNIEWVNGDALKLIPLLCRGGKFKIVGNIPYEITSPLLFQLLDHAETLSTSTLLMQKEVAARITAKPNTKDYGILSVVLQAHASCRKRFDVSPQNFFPPPKVMSSVIGLNFEQPMLPLKDAPFFRSVVRAAFGKRRKTLRNALLGSSLGVDEQQLDHALAASALDGGRRPETLTPAEYFSLATSLKSLL
ncbi:MAG: ribosomal RNA small subunit methyltransferase A [Deltaproteobacteria bacterium]|nr:ribosomal RNA small subunit methyltransferase A [Deltaproteobacteria bacterium]